MRETAGTLNRTWLAVVGLVMLLLGASGILLAFGAASGPLSVLGVESPAPGDRALPENFQEVFVPDTAAVLVSAVAVVIGLLALAWLLAQIPRRHEARTFRLHEDDAVDGRTTCEPRVITDAVESEVERLHGVLSATALLRGSASQPELTLDVTVDQHSDVRGILEAIHASVAPDLETALEGPLRRIAVLVTVGTGRGSDRTAVL